MNVGAHIVSINHLVEKLQQDKENTRCTLLVGAGCSFTSGVPLATEIVEIIKSKYPATWESSLKKNNGNSSYNEMMKSLTVHQRQVFFQDHVQNAKINLTHLCIATDRKSTRLNSSHSDLSRMPSSA